MGLTTMVTPLLPEVWVAEGLVFHCLAGMGRPALQMEQQIQVVVPEVMKDPI